MHIKECPWCQSDKIDCNVKLITKFTNGKNRVQAWAFCRGCGHRGLSVIGRYGSEEEAKEAALQMWNSL